MAHTQTRPATPGATSAFSPDFVELVTGICHDAELTTKALTSIVELLRGCSASHHLSAGGLLSLLEPIWGSLDTLCGDLRTVGNHIQSTEGFHHE